MPKEKQQNSTKTTEKSAKNNFKNKNVSKKGGYSKKTQSIVKNGHCFRLFGNFIVTLIKRQRIYQAYLRFY